MSDNEQINRIRDYFNEVDTLTAICRTKSPWRGVCGDYEKLEVGKTYRITHIGVFRSCANVILEGFPNDEYNATCFDIYEDGMPLGLNYSRDPRFIAPYLREDDRFFRHDKMIESLIPTYIPEIEQQNDVKVLLAVEAGSRAWGFQSADSDWDVRFIYVHKPQWYLRVEPQRDVIEKVIGDVDMAGWELRKALGLFKKCNPSSLEWFNSPIVYYVDEEFEQRIRAVEKDFFNPIRAMYHYNHMYVKHDERFLERKDSDMKVFFYYLRGVLACKWIEQHQTLPPVPFKELVNATVEDDTLRAKIDRLIGLKKYGGEHDMEVVDKELMDYARNLADFYSNRIGSFRPEQNENERPADALDAILYDMVRKYA